MHSFDFKWQKWVTHLIQLRTNVKGPSLRKKEPRFPRIPLDTTLLIASPIQSLPLSSRIMLPSKSRYRMTLPGSLCINSFGTKPDTFIGLYQPAQVLTYQTPCVKTALAGSLSPFNSSLLCCLLFISFSSFSSSLPPVLCTCYVISHLVTHGA